MMTLLTPNFADKQKENGVKKRGRPRIVAAHEPLSNEPISAPPVQLPTIPFGAPLAAQAAVGTSPLVTEQKVNVAPVAEPAPLKVALIGTAPSSRMLAPFNDPTWKIWGCSPGNQGVLPRVDMWFELHGNLLWPECRSYGVPYIEWLKQQKFPIYMQDNSLVPNAMPFPMKEMVEEFGPYFFTSSFTWMMALAIKMGAKEIALYGIDMASRDEYIIQRPGAYHFFLEGARRGCKIWAPYESDIMQPPGLYGYSDVGPLGRKMLARRSEIRERLAGMRQQRDGLTHNITYLEGADEDLDYMISIHMGAQDNASTSYLEKLLQKSSQG